MLPINIESIINKESAVEWERIEFKEGWNPIDIIHTLCAFANDFNNLDGGYIFIGIAEDKGNPILPPVGLSQSEMDKIQKELLNIGNTKITPPYHPIAYPFEMEGKNILVLRASGGENRPYQSVRSLAKEDKNRAYYIRRLSSTIEARGNYLTELMSLAQNVPFDDRYNQQATLNDFDIPLIEAFLEEVNSELASKTKSIEFEKLCRQMNIVGGSSETPLPKNVGLMFFAKNPADFFPHTQIDVVKLPSGAGGNKIIEKSFFGPINSQIRESLHYINTTVLEEVTIKSPHKAEADKFFNYPYQAIEELLVNAVYHRSYQEREPIEVRILPDRITITSYPGPDRSIKLEALASGNFIARRYRNRRIGEFLKELNLTEGRGTGIPKAIQAMTENGSLQPSFESDEDRSFFASILPIHPQALLLNTGGKTGDTTPTFTPTFISDSLSFLNDKAISLLEYCVTPRSRTEIRMNLQIKDAKHIRERYIYPLLSAKLFEMTDPEHPLSQSQRFKTTKLGKEAVEIYKETVSIKQSHPSLFD